MSIEFLLTSLVVVLLPGSGVIYTLSIGLSRGFRHSVSAAFGCTLGILPAALASIVGLSALLHTSSILFQAIKVLGALYLFYMAWVILKQEGAMDVRREDADAGMSYRRVAMNGTLINVLNPKLSLFFLAFLPQFVAADAQSPTASLVFLALVFMVMTFVVFVAYGAFAALARDYVISRPIVMCWIRRSFAGVFALLGLRLVMTDR